MNNLALQQIKNDAAKRYPLLDNTGLLGYIDIVALVDAMGIMGRECFEEWYEKSSKEENEKRSLGMRLAIIDSMDQSQLRLTQEKEEDVDVKSRIRERLTE